MPIAAGWAVLALLACLGLLADSSVASGPHTPLVAFALVLACSAPALVGGAFGVAEGRTDGRPDSAQVASLLRWVGNGIRAGVLLATALAIGVYLSGVTHDPPGGSVRTPSGGYALKLRDDSLVPVTNAQWRANSRAERRELLAGAILVNAWGGALCWAVKLRDDEEDPV
ncbi:hypothetical protein [Actinoplanes sp. NPDC026619]|uniref:hypothetical protein n=1 Tax=Actinoplanes sp. NPDC026619 TaxID=3155798 RepID=UPI0033D78A34